MSTGPDIPPSIRILPLPDEAKPLFSRAVRLAQAPEIARAVKPWLERYYSEQAVYERCLPDKQRQWDSKLRGYADVPTRAEMDWRANDCPGPGPTWMVQFPRDRADRLRQHQQAAKHPGYRIARAERCAGIKSVKAERKNWRPTLEDRLELAVCDITEAEYPDAPERIEHSRRVVAIAALLMPEMLPELGELGAWPFASVFHLSERTTGESPLERMIAAHEAEAEAASKGPHGCWPSLLDQRRHGRNEVAFVRMPGEERRLKTAFARALDALLGKLRVAVDDVSATMPVQCLVVANKRSARRGGSKQRYDADADAKTAMDRRASGQSIKAFAEDHGRKYLDVKHAIDRDRKRRK